MGSLDLYLQSGAIDTVVPDSVGRVQLIELSVCSDIVCHLPDNCTFDLSVYGMQEQLKSSRYNPLDDREHGDGHRSSLETFRHKMAAGTDLLYNMSTSLQSRNDFLSELHEDN